MKNIKVIRYFLIEVAFTLAMLVYAVKLHNVYSVSGPYEVEFVKITCLAIVALIWFFGPMLNRLVMLLVGEAYTFYLVGQDVYKRGFQQYCRFSTMKDLFGEVWGARASAFELVTAKDIMPFVLLLVICVAFFIVYLLLQRDCFSLKWRIPYKLAVLLLFFPAKSCLNNYNALVEDLRSQADAFQLYHSEYYAFDMMQNTKDFVEKYGLLTFAYRDGQKFFSNEVVGDPEREEIAAFMAEQPEQHSSQYHGLFEGKNAFFIQAESFINAAVDPDLTPTLYKMFNEGVVFDGFNTPLMAGSTSDTEFMANTSVIPITQGKSICYNFYQDTFPVTLPGVFGSYGFNPIIYHNNYGEYYNRTLFMPTLGYKTFFDCTGLGLEDEAPDSVVADVVQWIYSGTSNPYMAYWITYSGHQPYQKDSVGVSEEDWAAIYAKYPDIDENFASFLAKNMDLDRGLGNMMNLLADNGKLDDVVFIFFGDHFAKGIDFTESSDFYKQTGKDYSFDSSYTGLVFYNSATEGFHYYKEGTILDLLPTVCDLWNFDYDAHAVFGRSLFDDEYDGFYFTEYGNWRSNYYEFDSTTGTLTARNNASFDMEKAQQEMSRRVKEREICNKILELDYFGTQESSN